ncbi:MAG: hypothetical protein VYD37_07105 [Gemmatimonadota bacterium]|nr:hypothetical protein [Gemmatimonadota bacterium]
MSKLTFTDGVSFDIDGPYRVTRRKDGWYFVGGGMLCPVDSYEEGYEMKQRLEADEVCRAAEDSNGDR